MVVGPSRVLISGGLHFVDNVTEEATYEAIKVCQGDPHCNIDSKHDPVDHPAASLAPPPEEAGFGDILRGPAEVAGVAGKATLWWPGATICRLVQDREERIVAIYRLLDFPLWGDRWRFLPSKPVHRLGLQCVAPHSCCSRCTLKIVAGLAFSERDATLSEVIGDTSIMQANHNGWRILGRGVSAPRAA
ncbi:MAG: hypothetical protein F4X77_10630 [Acidobacteriia bacterium]|nr:hypothetical protein [Terriglobia bacterium]